MRYISLFSGVEAASVAWKHLGWEPVAFSEIDEFPSAVLAEHYPDVPNLGDITKVDWKNYAGTIDLIVGGSPCQSFSIAGSRTGLKGESGLMFEYIRAVREIMPRYFLWENVPGALSSENGAAFGQLLAEMDDIGYSLAWRVLDAQFFGVPQRRRRVFLVGCIGDRSPAEILFEPEGLRWDSLSSREQRAALTRRAQGSLGGSRVSAREPKTIVVRCGKPGGGKGALVQENVSGTLATSNTQTLFVPICMADDNAHAAIDVNMCGSLKVGGSAPILAGKQPSAYVARKLTPVECERLQGFPDGWTDIEFKGKASPDTKRYKAMGNSMAVPVMRWIGDRIAQFDESE